jgi:hypothetical protein
LKTLLNLNESGGGGGNGDGDEVGAHSKSGGKEASAWKVLVYDEFCRDVISPLLNVGALRELGVTLHLNLDTERLGVPDVPAVYFVRPTEANVLRIARDLKDGLYEQLHINFAGACPRALLERLAELALACDGVSRIARVHDQYVGFQSLAPHLFTLAQPRSYIAFNDPRVSDAVAQSNIERCVDGLFAVLAVCGVTPVIRCPRNGAAEMVARGLSQRLHELAAERLGAGIGATGSASSALSSFRRPLLVIVERGTDLATMLHHPWTYGAMVHDVLGLRLNRVRVASADQDGGGGGGDAASASAAAPVERTFDLDARDTFWAAHGGAPFQQVAVEVKEAVNEYKAKVARLDALRDGSGGGSVEAAVAGGDELGGIVSEIPELQAKKQIIETHTNIATALLKQVKRRELDRFYALEETLLARGSCDRAELRHLLGGQSGQLSDRVRLLLIHYLCAVERAPPTSAVATEFAKFEATLRDAGADLSALQYVRQARAHLGSLSLPSELSSDHDQSSSATATTESSDSGAGWLALQKGYESLSAFTSVFSDGVERLKTLLPREQELPITRIVRALMEQRAAKGVDQYLYFDPNVDGGRSSAAPAPAPNADATRTAYREAIVFVVGGGNYVEHQNLTDYAAGVLDKASKRGAAPQPKTIIYGATELLSSDEFVAQLKALTADTASPATAAPAAAPSK